MGRRREKPEVTIEEFHQWRADVARVEEIAERADEPGGPRLILVPPALPRLNEPLATDFLAPEERPAGEPPLESRSFEGFELPESRKRKAGWSAERQRLFLEALAETGQIHIAADYARLSARSAQALRNRSPAFASAWNIAEQLAARRLASIAFDRAINGRIEQIYADGQLVGEKRVPSDRLLTWLLARLDPKRFALPWEQRGTADPQADAAAAWPALLSGIKDVPA